MCQQPYHLPHVYKEAVEKEIELMLKQGIIEPASGEWASSKRKMIQFAYV